MGDRYTETRSNSGCWTCRLRKKKCDETRPRCVNCDLLHISCFGFGRKPDWMDGGDMERAVAKATLEAVRETTNRNRNRRLRRSQNLSDSYTAPAPVHLPAGDVLGADTSPPAVEYDIDMDGAFLDDMTTIAVKLPPPLDLDPFPSVIDPAVLQVRTVSPLPANINMANHSRNLLEEPSTSSDDIGEKGASSIMDYMDSVFFFQFPLYCQFPSIGGRGWLLWFLVHVRPLRTITEALCVQCHQSLQLQPIRATFDSEQEKELEGSLSPLLPELNRYIGRVGLHEVDVREGKTNILACIVQLIFLEVFRGEYLMWRMHLDAASSLIAILAADKFCSPGINQLRPTAYDDAFKFFGGLFVWFDVISAASMGTKHLTHDEDERLLESNAFDLGSLVGCENWIVMTLLKISDLNHWKQERERDGKLSFAELVRRSEPLERRLKQSLATSSGLVYRSGITSDPSNAHGNPDKKETITSIFVGSALSYLHFVVSGAHPELLEIRESITITIEAFKKLPHPWLLRSLAWPFCVTGCFALPEERVLLRNLVSAAGVTGPNAGNLWKALEVVEQCWTLRESSDGLCDWVKAASSLGYDILLI